MYGLNSRLEHDAQGNLTENTYKTDGLYGEYIKHINDELSAARPYAETPRQQHIIDLLTRYYQTGSLHTFDQYTIEWIQETQGTIDFINGFTEVYGDPLGLKASWEGYVNILDTCVRPTRYGAHVADENKPEDNTGFPMVSPSRVIRR